MYLKKINESSSRDPNTQTDRIRYRSVNPIAAGTSRRVKRGLFTVV